MYQLPTAVLMRIVHGFSIPPLSPLFLLFRA